MRIDFYFENKNATDCTGFIAPLIREIPAIRGVFAVLV
jgi:hypothetical protein